MVLRKSNANDSWTRHAVPTQSKDDTNTCHALAKADSALKSAVASFSTMPMSVIRVGRRPCVTSFLIHHTAAS